MTASVRLANMAANDNFQYVQYLITDFQIQMLAFEQRKLTLQSYHQNKTIKIMQEEEAAPQLIAHHLKTQKTDQEDRHPYQQPSRMQFQSEGISPQKSVKETIQLAMILLEHNDDLAKKIELVTKQIEDQELKANIFQEQIHKNNTEISRLKLTQAERAEQSKNQERMRTLNESNIPNKSVQLSTTGNTNCWINEFLNKQELQSLWIKRQTKPTKQKKQQIIKCFTIDLSTCAASTRQKKQNIKSKGQNKSIQQYPQSKSLLQKSTDKTKKTIISVAHYARNATNRCNLKVNLNDLKSNTQDRSKNLGQQYDKNKLANKTISQLRTAKKIRPNPQL